MTSNVAPVQPGQAAPGFSLPGINREGRVALAEFRGRAPGFIGLYRGLHCPFCRRHIAALGGLHAALKAAGVETVAVVNTPLDRARLYYRQRPTPVMLASDPETATHRAYGLPKPEVGEEMAWPYRASLAGIQNCRLNPTGDLPEPLPLIEANNALNVKDGYEVMAADQAMLSQHMTQLGGQFLVDREGVVRWSFVEALKDIGDLGIWPRPEEVLAAARALV